MPTARQPSQPSAIRTSLLLTDYSSSEVFAARLRQTIPQISIFIANIDGVLNILITQYLSMHLFFKEIIEYQYCDGFNSSIL